LVSLESLLEDLLQKKQVNHGLQEVKETLLLPRKCQSATERHLCPQAMHKKAIKPNPHPDPWDHGFLSPSAFPLCSLSLFFSTNKIFPTSGAGVHLNQILFLLIKCSIGKISGPNRSPKTVKTDSKYAHAAI
jgi:hypothetical protein